ncbi:MAG: protein TonB [Myxococcota bacterium]|jgi:protein TonB
MRYLRTLPSAVAERNRRSLERSSLIIAVVIHAGLMVWVATIPDHVRLQVLEPAPYIPRMVEVIQVTRAEAKEEPVVEIVEPEPEEPPRVATLEPMPEPPVATPPRVEPEPSKIRPKPVKRARPKRRRVAKRTPRRAPKRVAKAAAPAGPVTPITAPDESVAGAGEPGVEDPTASEQGTGAVAEPVAGSEQDVVDAPGDPDAPPEVDLRGVLSGYIGRVAGVVKRQYRYPRAAERAGLEGKVLIEIVVDAHGKIVSARVVGSSGHPVLDKAAMKSLAKITRVPAPPAELKWTTRKMQVPFVYSLDRRRS